MKVEIKNVDKSKGLVFKEKLYGVMTHVTFTEEEQAIITERNLAHMVLMDRSVPADVDPDKHANRGIVKRLATAAIKGRDANHFDLTAAKLLAGPDTYFMFNEHERNVYHEEMRGALRQLKDLIESTAETAQDESFEL